MNPFGLWTVCFVLGAGDALLTGLLGLIFGGIFFAFAVPLADGATVRRRCRDCCSGSGQRGSP